MDLGRGGCGLFVGVVCYHGDNVIGVGVCVSLMVLGLDWKRLQLWGGDMTWG